MFYTDQTETWQVMQFCNAINCYHFDSLCAMIDYMFLLDWKPVPMFWPNDSILNWVCCVLIELVYVEKYIQHFEM